MIDTNMKSNNESNIKLKNGGFKKEYLLIGFAVLAVAAVAIYWFYFRTPVLSADQAKTVAEKFIQENLLSPGVKADIKSIAEDSGLYKIILNIGSGQDITAYISRDGQKFFPQAMDIAEVEKQAAGAQKQTEAAPVKSDQPAVELFVMSYCPYGTQIEKGILPVLNALGDKIKFTLKFVNYAMHNKQEIDENLRQYCIQKEQGDKLNNYLTCFLKAGEADNCLKSTGVNASKLANCVAQTDAEFKITEKFNDKNSWGSQYPPFDVDKADNEKYGVQGSPTIVINGQSVNSDRDPASLLKLICSAFNNQPAECSAQLSADQPSPGFGEGTSNTTSGDCGQ